MHHSRPNSAPSSRENSPKYLSCLNPDLELQFHYKVHTSLDMVEEKLSSLGKSSGDVRELYLGLLYSTEEHKIAVHLTLMQPVVHACLHSSALLALYA
uniref:(California timema) hypothetical protein n=1 Tax=Timema californicum TaxID=61474 RepID=A0A7R9PE40_TIMCA|nr:unnamed protein product [Timema californicum]